MKYIYLLTLICITFFSCKKNDNRNLSSENEYLIPFSESSKHCYNNILDGDETEIDCGGSCEICIEAIPSCTLDVNTAMVNNNIKLITNINQLIQPGNNIIELSFKVGNMPCEILFEPNYTKKEPFQIINGWGIEEQEMSLELYNPVYNYLVSSTFTKPGTGYINSSDNGQYEVYICNSSYSSNNYPISLHLLIP